MNAENPCLYPKRSEVFGPHRLYTNSGSSPDAERPQPVLHFLFGKLGEQLVADGTVQNPHAQDYFVFYPNHIVHGSPAMHLTHTVTPLSAGRSRGIFRFYWVGDDRSPTDRLVREFSMAFGREIHAEDGDVLRRCQLGLQGGALEHIHFQQQEVMCRHLYESTVAEIDAWLAEHGSEGAVT